MYWVRLIHSEKQTFNFNRPWLFLLLGGFGWEKANRVLPNASKKYLFYRESHIPKPKTLLLCKTSFELWCIKNATASYHLMSIKPNQKTDFTIIAKKNMASQDLKKRVQKLKLNFLSKAWRIQKLFIISLFYFKQNPIKCKLKSYILKLRFWSHVLCR